MEELSLQQLRQPGDHEFWVSLVCAQFYLHGITWPLSPCKALGAHKTQVGTMIQNLIPICEEKDHWPLAAQATWASNEFKDKPTRHCCPRLTMNDPKVSRLTRL